MFSSPIGVSLISIVIQSVGGGLLGSVFVPYRGLFNFNYVDEREGELNNGFRPLSGSL